MKPIALLGMLMCLVLIPLWAISAPAAETYPPWCEPPEGGVNFTVPCVNNAPDLHGDIENPDLVVFFGGNQFMVLPEVFKAFQADYPQYKKIFYETLPPGIVAKQVKTGSLVMGNLKITHKPDVFVAGEQRLRDMDKEQGLFEKIQPYYRNRLAIMVRLGNPKRIESLVDLGREDVRVSMPNPETEGIAKKAMEAFKKSEGEDLVKKIMEAKVKRGTTFITQIHHRQTPMRLMENLSDAGPVWISEALFQKKIGNPIDMVEIPEEKNVTSTTAAGVLRGAPHQQAARDFVNFLTTAKAKAIYRQYGFMPLE